ncbi:MAG: hypothetical protein HQ495_14715 [Alphaproteobacteria bacterium]|nr:hypothetical protein [Alphaproteobacteria bacterium]
MPNLPRNAPGSVEKLRRGGIDALPCRAARIEEAVMRINVPDLVSHAHFPATAAVAPHIFKPGRLDHELDLRCPVDPAFASVGDRKIRFLAGSARGTLAGFPGWVGSNPWR